MTRCVYLTFFGEYRGHGHPHESREGDHGPADRPRGVRRCSPASSTPSPLDIEKFAEWVEPRGRVPDRSSHSEFDYPLAALSVAVAAIGIGIAAFFWFKREELGALKGLTERNRLAHAGYTFLENKYYLDDLYENVIVGVDQGPDRTRRLLDQPERDRRRGQRRRPRRAARRAASSTTCVDQKVVDGAVNGIAEVTGETGGLLRYLQSGRVQRYALFLFAAVGLLSLALLIANI